MSKPAQVLHNLIENSHLSLDDLATLVALILRKKDDLSECKGGWIEYDEKGVGPVIIMVIPGFNELPDTDKAALSEIDMSLQVIAENFEYLSPYAKILVQKRFDDMRETAPVEVDFSHN